MAQCVAIVNLDGLDVFAPSMADPCTSFVALTPAEYAALSQNPFNLSPEDGALVAGAVIGVWCIAWACRALYRALATDGEASE
jgi:hypothetical protein